MEWSSWHHRKALGLLEAATHRPLRRASRSSRVRTLWIAGLFALGSVGFALGSLPPLAAALRDNAAGLFFGASLLFTTAAYMQFHEAANAGDDVNGQQRTHRLARLRTESLGWWATSTQLVGTLAFNISTLAAMVDLSPWREETLVWAPDAVGSICFLVASTAALSEICSRVLCWDPRSSSWWVAAINLAGSLAFGVSAVAARVLPTTGEPANIDRVNSATFIGAALFLAAALLLPAAVGLSPRRRGR